MRAGRNIRPLLSMIKPAITMPLTKQEIANLVLYLSHHLGYVPTKQPNVIFAKSAKVYASLFYDYELKSKALSQERIVEVNSDTPAFFDHITDSVVFQGFSYKDGIEIDSFIIPMSTVIHELIHFFQYATGTFGTSRIMYEGTNEILSALLADDPKTIDYRKEASYAMALAMEINGHSPIAALQWMKKYTTHSSKNAFVYRSIRQCTSLSKYNPKKLLQLLDDDRLDEIENEETRAILKRYPMGKIVKLLKTSTKIIHGDI